MITIYLNDRLYSFDFSMLDMMRFIASGENERMNKALKEKDLSIMTEIFADIILKSYYAKSEEDFNEFKNSSAFKQIFMMLARDPKMSTKFFNGILPSSLKNHPS